MPVTTEESAVIRGALEFDANLYVCNALTMKEWKARWGHLKPPMYATLPIEKWDKRRVKLPDA